jgi:hypothetical protein
MRTPDPDRLHHFRNARFPNRWRDSRAIEENVKRRLRPGHATMGLPISGKSSATLREMAMKAAEYKPRRGLFALTLPIPEKAIANQIKRAHGKRMHHNGVAAELCARSIVA